MSSTIASTIEAETNSHGTQLKAAGSTQYAGRFLLGYGSMEHIDATHIAQRVRDLLRLGADAGASDNEARNAALTAARLILQHNLIVISRSIIDEERNKRLRAEERARAAEARAQKAEENARSAEARAVTTMEPEAKRRKLSLQWSTRCIECGCFLDEGDVGWWRKSGGVSCLDCGASV